MKIFPLLFMYCSNLSYKFSRQTQKKLVGFSHYGHFSDGVKPVSDVSNGGLTLEKEVFQIVMARLEKLDF
jgi:hypothetical protein